MPSLVSALVLSATVLIGMALARWHVRGQSPSLLAGLSHASAGVAGACLLAWAAWLAGDAYRLNTALILVILALLGGGFMLVFRFDGDRAPGFMIVLHALAGMAALVLVWLAVLG